MRQQADEAALFIANAVDQLQAKGQVVTAINQILAGLTVAAH